MMEAVSVDTILNMEEPQRDISKEYAAFCEQTWHRVLEQLQAIIPRLNAETLQNAFWHLVHSMSHTHSQPYLEDSENIRTTVRNGEYARCFYTAVDGGAVLARLHAPLTFLVDARGDFIYTHVIDQLLLQEYENAEQLEQMACERYERRARHYKHCPLEASAAEKHGEGER